MKNHFLDHGAGEGHAWRQAGRLLCLLLFWVALGPLAPLGAKAAPGEAVVSVVVVNEQGEPCRQGQGVVVGKDGLVLTSAALLGPGRGAIVKTGGGDKLVVLRVLHWDFFQDLALAQAGAEGLPAASLAGSRGVKSGEQVWVGVRHNPPVLQEARVAGVMPFSPRLTLLRLEPGNLEVDLGAPVFNGRGELMGMFHAFAGDGEKSPGFQFFLARDRSHLPGDRIAPEEAALEWPEKLEEDAAIRACRVFWQGVAASLHQAWPEAQEKFSAALRLSASLPEAQYGRGVARYHLGDYQASAQDLEQASRALPGYALAFLWLGKDKQRQGQQDAALAAYEKAATADPALSEAWFMWGTALYRQGNLDRAREYLEKAGDDFPQAAQRWWYLGVIAQSGQHSEKAIRAFQRARELDPAFFPPYVEEGKLLIEAGRPQEAAKLLAKVVQSNPQWPWPRFYLGLAYFRSANIAGAWEQYFALQKIHPALAMRLVSILEQP